MEYSINSRRWIESILIKPISTDFVRRKIPAKIKFVLKQNEVDLIEPIYCNNLQWPIYIYTSTYFYICSSKAEWNGSPIDRRQLDRASLEPVRNSILELGKAKYNQEVSVGSDLRMFSSPSGPSTRINHVQVGLSPWQKFRPRYCISPEGTCVRAWVRRAEN